MALEATDRRDAQGSEAAVEGAGRVPVRAQEELGLGDVPALPFVLVRNPDHAAIRLDRQQVESAIVVAIGDGDRHNHDDLPIVLAGGGGRTAVGRHVRLSGPVPLNNLFLGMLARLGVARDRLGDSTGVFEDF